MHAVVFEVDVKQGWEGDAGQELDQVASMVKSVPGFVRGTWANDDRRGLSFIVFESEEAARGLAENASMPPDASVTFRSVAVYETVRET
ncbi:MAG: antibiotic biosynthesis monooxygenase [Acidimicrobiales bacterium]